MLRKLTLVAGARRAGATPLVPNDTIAALSRSSVNRRLSVLTVIHYSGKWRTSAPASLRSRGGHRVRAGTIAPARMLDQAVAVAATGRRRRTIPTMPNPASIISHVLGSGTAAAAM